MRNRDSKFGSEPDILHSLDGVTQAEIATHTGIVAGPSHLNASASQSADQQAHSLFAAAVAGRWVSAGENIQASTPVATLAKSFAKSASHITGGKDARFEAILLED